MINDILDLVKENNRVIIPNFGAFIISKDNGYSVLFNNFLSFNDGLLVNHIAEKRGVDAGVALVTVNEFVDSIKKTLDSDGKFEIKSLGSFTKDDGGVIRFHQDEDIASLFDQPVNVKKEEKELLDIDSTPNIIEDKKEEKLISKDVPNSLKRGPLLQIDQEEISPKVEPKKEEVKITIKAEAPKKKPEEIKKEPIAATIRNEKINIQQLDIERKQKQAPVVEENKKKSSLVWFVLLFVLIPALGFGIYWFYYRNAPQPVMVLKPEVVAPVDTVKKVVAVEMPEPPKVATTYEKRYQIIAGTFSSENAANAYVAILKGKGFENSLIIPRYNKFLVSIDAEKDLISAEARQEEIVNKYRIENYIITVK